ncbi:MAG: MATE family efflux transporter [Bacteroidales bacterium]|nr:MATE family efflux transporter [Bacteroidales bacterium]
MADLTKGKESRRIIYFALPMLLGNVFQQLYNVVDTIIVGKYIGKEALAAVGASFPVIFVLVSLLIGVSAGVTILIAQYYGAKQFENVHRSITTMFSFALVSAIILGGIGIYFSDDIFKLIRLPKEVIPMASSYFTIFASGLVFLFGFNATSAILRGTGDSKTPLYFLIISTLANILFDFLFVVGMDMGVEGAALATVLSQAGAFFTAVIYLNRTHEIISFRIRNWVFDGEILKKGLKIGIPSGLQHTFVAFGMIALFRIVNDFGTNTVAAYTAAIRIDSFAGMPAMSLSAALSTFVGQNLGANRPERVKKGLYATWLISFGVSLVISLIVILFGQRLMGAFTSDQTVKEIGHSYLMIVGAFYIVFSSMFINQAVLRGAGDTITSMLITLFSLWLLRIPASYLLSRESVGLGYEGIWWGIPIAWFFGFLASYIYYRTGRWKRKVVVKAENGHGEQGFYPAARKYE